MLVQPVGGDTNLFGAGMLAEPLNGKDLVLLMVAEMKF